MRLKRLMQAPVRNIPRPDHRGHQMTRGHLVRTQPPWMASPLPIPSWLHACCQIRRRGEQLRLGAGSYRAVAGSSVALRDIRQYLICYRRTIPEAYGATTSFCRAPVWEILGGSNVRNRTCNAAYPRCSRSRGDMRCCHGRKTSAVGGQCQYHCTVQARRLRGASGVRSSSDDFACGNLVQSGHCQKFAGANRP